MDTNLCNFLWGAWTGFSWLPVLVPVELFKWRAQALKQTPGNRNTYSIKRDFRNVLRTEGPFGLFKGALPTFCREVPGWGMLFMTKDMIERQLNANSEDQKYSIRLAKKVVAGGVAGVCAWCASLPIDTVKSVIQASNTHKSIGEVTQELYKSGGMKSFFRGFIPQVFRIFPASSSSFIVYELLKSHMI